MIDHKAIDELSSKISNLLPEGVKLLKADLEKNIQALVEATFSQMNLVSREEFEVQAALLQRTREKLARLEQQLAELTQQNR
ncbi:MAG: accessory factor UbiK family protein [Gammaproteobacteria bacterium]|nr:MAG: accessory factor UbiK family protein [Gammaproteobacteria bacterium]